MRVLDLELGKIEVCEVCVPFCMPPASEFAFQSLDGLLAIIGHILKHTLGLFVFLGPPSPCILLNQNLSLTLSPKRCHRGAMRGLMGCC